MRTLTNKELASLLSTRSGGAKHRYFPQEVLPRRHVILPESLPLDTIMRGCRDFAQATRAVGPFVIASDGFSGWRSLPRSSGTRALLVADLDETERVMAAHSYFRRRLFDNYYVFDQSVEWFVVFCHDDDVHFRMSDRIWRRARVQRWLATYEPGRMQI